MRMKRKLQSTKAGKRQRGAAMVETALVLLLVVSMIVFILDMGRLLLTEQYASDRARTAVRNAVVNSWSASDVQNYVAYGTTSPALLNGEPGFLGITPSQVTFTSYPDSGLNDARYQVKIQGIPLLTWVPGISGRYTAPAVTATAPVQSQGATN